MTTAPNTPRSLGNPVSVFRTHYEPCSWCGAKSPTQRTYARVDQGWRGTDLYVCSHYTDSGCRAAWLLGQSPAEFRSAQQ